MAEINDWDITASGNNDAPPDGFPENMDYSKVNDSAREVMSVLARLYKDTNGSLTASGVNDVILTTNATYTSLYQGLRLSFKAANSNSGAMTLKVGALAAATLLNTAGGTMVANSVLQNLVYDVVYNGSAFQLVTNGFTFPGGNPGFFSASSPDVTPTLTDKVAIKDASDSENPKFSLISALKTLISVFSPTDPSGTAVTSDLLHFQDVSDSNNPKTDTILNILALAPASSSLVDFKDSVRAATTAAGTLATSFENADVIDGVTLATGDRILIKDQSTGSENGIYTVNATGAPTRATDFDADAEVTPGAMVVIEEGTANADKIFILTTNGTIVVGTTALTFSAVSAGASDFLGLTDTPSSFTGQGGKTVAVNSGATALEFITPASSNTGSWIRTQTLTATGVANADIPFPSGADLVKVEITYTPGTDNTNLRMNVTTDNFSTVKGGTSDYRWGYERRRASGIDTISKTDFSDNSDARVNLVHSNGAVSDEYFQVTLYVRRPSSSGFRTMFQWSGVQRSNAGFDDEILGYAAYNTAEVTDGIRLTSNSGNVNVVAEIFELNTG